MSKQEKFIPQNSAQLVYLDFDGELTQYNNSTLGIDLDVEMLDSQLSTAQQQTIIAALNEKYAADNVQFTMIKPEDDSLYSTVFVGRSDDFMSLGAFAGLAENIDKGNLIKNDDAFVFVDDKYSIDTVISIIDHEVGHLLGAEHEKQSGTINDYAATKWEVEGNGSSLFSESQYLADNAGSIYSGDTTVFLKGYSSSYTDYDWFKFYAGSTGSLRFYEYASGYKYRLSLYNSSGTQLYTATDYDIAFNYYVTAGNTYYLRVDPMESLSSYSYNYSIGIYYSSVTTYEPDLKVQNYSVSSSSITSSQSVTLSFEIGNIGSGSSSSSYAYIYDGNTYLGNVYVGSLSPNYYRTCSYTISAGRLSTGTHNIYVVADGSSSVSESNESNNQAYRTITVTQTKADLRVEDYEVSSTSISSTGSVKLSFKVANRGNAYAGSSLLRVYSGNTLLKTYTIGGISANSYRNCTVTLNGSQLGTGSKKIYLVTDAAGAISEFNESNNKAYRTITVTQAKADLRVEDYEVSSTSISSTGSVKLSFKVANRGNAYAGSSLLRVYSGNTLLKTYIIGSISANDSRNCTVTLNGSQLGAGSKKIYLVADAAGAISESNESNNKAYRTITVKNGAPDLRVENYNVSATNITDYGSVKLSFKVANRGNASVGSSSLKIYSGNTLIKTYTLGSISANDYRNCTVTLNGYQLPYGSQRIYAVVDANNQYNESNENNNKAYRTVNVSPVYYADSSDTSDWLLADDMDMQQTNSDCDLADWQGDSAAQLADLTDSLGSGLSYGGAADWNNDGTCEVLFCGSEESIAPQVEGDNRLKLLA